MSDPQSPWKGMSMVSIIGMDVGIGTYGGVWLGKKADVYLSSAPWGIVVGAFVGMGVGVLLSIPVIKRLLGDN